MTKEQLIQLIADLESFLATGQPNLADIIAQLKMLVEPVVPPQA